MRKSGVEIQYRLEVPLVVFLGDTTAGTVFDEPDVQNAEVLITEFTFFEPEHRTKAKAGRHLHIEQFAELLPKLKNRQIILGHVSRRTGTGPVGDCFVSGSAAEAMGRIQFLMDFEGSADAGDVEQAGPNPGEGAE